MEAKDAVKLAKAYVETMFSEENIRDIGLEEIDFEPSEEMWEITVGFRRPSIKPKIEETGDKWRFMHDKSKWIDRWYKVVEIENKNGNVVRMRDRRLQSVA